MNEDSRYLAVAPQKHFQPHYTVSPGVPGQELLDNVPSPPALNF